MSTGADTYNDDFYARQRDESRRSADAVTPVLMEWFAPKSVLDVGCGVGTWCASFERQGVPVVTGLDGPWVDKKALQMKPEGFVSFDFAAAPKPYAPPLPQKRYDLAISFEFLEHVAHAHAPAVVEFMTGASDLIVSGAAIPGQGGRHHVNEQWPSYWSELFAARGFETFDCVRPVIAHQPGIEAWYVQNPILYAKSPIAPALKAKLDAAVLAALAKPAPWVHPALYAGVKKKLNKRLSTRLEQAWRKLTK